MGEEPAIAFERGLEEANGDVIGQLFLLGNITCQQVLCLQLLHLLTESQLLIHRNLTLTRSVLTTRESFVLAVVEPGILGIVAVRHIPTDVLVLDEFQRYLLQVFCCLSEVAFSQVLCSDEVVEIVIVVVHLTNNILLQHILLTTAQVLEVGKGLLGS